MAWWIDKMASFGNSLTDNIEKGVQVLPGMSRGIEVIENLTGRTANLQYEQSRQDKLHSYANSIQAMAEAGLNPALLYGGSEGSIGVASPSASSSGGAAGLSAVAGMIASLSQAALTQSKSDNLDADTDKKKAEAQGKIIDNYIKGELGYDTAIAELRKLDQSVSESEARELLIKAQKTNTDADTARKVAETTSIQDQNEAKKLLGDYTGRTLKLYKGQSFSINTSAGALSFSASAGYNGSASGAIEIPEEWFVKAQSNTEEGKKFGDLIKALIDSYNVKSRTASPADYIEMTVPFVKEMRN